MKPQIIIQNLAWVEPLEFAAQLTEDDFVLLYSGVRNGYSGRYSLLACGLERKITSDNFAELAGVLSQNQEKFANAWFGYLAYGLKDSLESLTKEAKNWLSLPPLLMMQFASIYQFDHETKTLTLYSSGVSVERDSCLRRNDALPSVCKITSNMTRGEYLEKAAEIIEKINDGELYQANLTRKFMGEFADAPNQFQLFKKLCEVSPAAYSAFIKIGDTAILSSSPESFLHIDEAGNVVTRPIKGTAARGKTAEEDEKLRKNLQNSEKDRAENLMIVDLMRNDLAKSCAEGSIKVEKLFEVTTHATIHHLSSTISGKRRSDKSTLDVVCGAFPAGSMTGAPKIRAMNLCAELENEERGVYSGAVGWFGGDGSCDLSVVIRTLILQGNKFEFQVGGGIVADSTPEKELQETIDKAKGILLALGVEQDYIGNQL